jgi:tyrosyl-tRNA synthetase
MSKSFNNFIGIDFEANEMFGKIMSIPDQLIIKYFILCTNLPLSEINEIKEKIEKGENPRDFKAKLAYEIVKIYHGEKLAQKAEAEFNRIFKEKKLPTQIPVLKLKDKELKLVDLIKKTDLVPSKSEIKRLISQGGIKIDGKVERNWQKKIEIKDKIIIQIGKRKFIQIEKN